MAKIELGGGPHDEDCAQIGPDLPRINAALNLLECRAFILALRRVYGEPPAGVRFRVLSAEHDFGRYHEVAVHFDPGDRAACDYAAKCEAGVAFWSEAGMWAPVQYNEHGRPTRLIREPKFWIMAENPDHLTEPVAQAPLIKSA